ncbi:MAG: hypothetical protein GY866_29670, partial [Proteobacteria bacterium]|nr:hypothetical protein [Pseudomonadota bacterium]
YNPVFKAMEEAVEDLKNEQAIIESEGRDPDEILIENLIEGIADPRSIPFLELYENDLPKGEDAMERLEVKFLVDASSSTEGMILEVEKVFAAVIYRAFELLGFDVELYFFEGYKETTVTHTTTLNAIGHVESGYCNRDGAAIRYLTRQFKRTEDQSLLIMISDGMPYAYNYYDEGALEDTCHAMYSASQQGIMIRYFNIGGLPEKIFRAFRSHTRHTNVFYDPQELIAFAPIFIAELLEEIRSR